MVTSNLAPPNFRKVKPPKNGKGKPPIGCAAEKPYTVTEEGIDAFGKNDCQGFWCKTLSRMTDEMERVKGLFYRSRRDLHGVILR